MYKKLAAAVLAFAALSSAHISAHAETIEDGRVWLNVNMIGRLPAENWRWYAELQPRWREEGETFDQVLIRPAVLYDFNKQTSAWLGYANVITDRPAESPLKNIVFGNRFCITLARLAKLRFRAARV